jgi:uncharacterized RDD family membrane protein YckC
MRRLTHIRRRNARQHAVRRFVARGIDVAVYFFVVLTVGAFLVPETYADLDSPLRIVTAYACAVLSLPYVESCVAYWFKHTPGKALLGINVTTAAGKPLSFGEWEERSKQALLGGAWAIFPIVTPFCLRRIFAALARGEPTEWDEMAGYKVHFYRPHLAVTATTTMLIAVALASGSISVSARDSGQIAERLERALVLLKSGLRLEGKPAGWVNPETGKWIPLNRGWSLEAEATVPALGGLWDVCFRNAKGPAAVALKFTNRHDFVFGDIPPDIYRSKDSLAIATKQMLKCTELFQYEMTLGPLATVPGYEELSLRRADCGFKERGAVSTSSDDGSQFGCALFTWRDKDAVWALVEFARKDDLHGRLRTHRFAMDLHMSALRTRR